MHYHLMMGNTLPCIYYKYMEMLISQQLIEIVFVVQLQTLHKISHRKKKLENLTSTELYATNIK